MVYAFHEGRAKPPIAEREELQAMERRLAAQLSRIEAVLAQTPSQAIQTRRRLRADRAVVADERRRVALALGGSRLVERLTIRLERVRAGPRPITDRSIARLATSFRHRVVDHAAGTVVDSATGMVLDDRIRQSGLRPLPADIDGSFEGRPLHVLRAEVYRAHLVAGLPNPFRCVVTEKLLQLEDFVFLSSLPGMPISVRVELGEGRWREWRLLEWAAAERPP